MDIYRKEMKNLKKYVPGKSVEDVIRTYKLDKIVKLASNENPLGPSPLAINAIKEGADKVHVYPDGSALALREKLAEIHGLDTSQIIIGAGGEQLIKVIAQTFINEGDEILMASPSFSLYDIWSRHIGARVIALPLTGDFKHDFEAFYDHLTEKTKIVYVCNPNNPTGNIMTKAEVLGLSQKLPEDCILMLDEAYFEYAQEDPDYLNGLEVLKLRKNTVVLRTFSKVAGLAGLRIGYAFSSPENIEQMTKIKGVFNANRLGQEAALASLEDQGHIQETLALNKKLLGLMKAFFDENKMAYIPSHANFIFVKMKMSSRLVYEELLKRGVIIRPGYLWGWDDWIRVSSGSIEATKFFIDRLKEII